MVFALLALLAASPEDRAIQYLSAEVPRWFEQNRCHSCHNNGDGARALYRARAAPDVLQNTTSWLQRPDEWDSNRGDPAFSDKKLATLQFAAALSEATAAGAIGSREPLRRAARLLAAQQDRNGAWSIEQDTGTGSPVTYGAALATYLARQILKQTGEAEFAAALSRSAAWLRSVPAVKTVDNAAVLLALPDESGARLAALLGARTTDGGWGPQRSAPAEVFDTAVAVLALSAVQGKSAEAAAALREGRAYLVRTQLASGGWTETTRPPGSQSYAQHISTSAWALLALLGR